LTDAGSLIQAELRLQGFTTLPQAHFPDPIIERAAQLVDARRALPIHNSAIPVNDRVNAVVFKYSAGRNADLLHGHAIQGFYRKYCDPAKMHATSLPPEV
jgi:hypothetical protein